MIMNKFKIFDLLICGTLCVCCRLLIIKLRLSSCVAECLRVRGLLCHIKLVNIDPPSVKDGEKAVQKIIKIKKIKIKLEPLNIF